MHVLMKKDGKYLKQTFSTRCLHNHIRPDFSCQGSTEHEGYHWMYDKRGWLIQVTDKGVRISTPPGHVNYTSPIDNLQNYYMSSYVEEEITDPEEIKALKHRNMVIIGDNDEGVEIQDDGEAHSPPS